MHHRHPSRPDQASSLSSTNRQGCAYLSASESKMEANAGRREVQRLSPEKILSVWWCPCWTWTSAEEERRRRSRRENAESPHAAPSSLRVFLHPFFLLCRPPRPGFGFCCSIPLPPSPSIRAAVFLIFFCLFLPLANVPDDAVFQGRRGCSSSPVGKDAKPGHSLIWSI